MKFIKITDKWYVRDSIIRDVWISNDDTQLNVGYCISGMSPDHISSDNKAEIKERFDQVIRQLNHYESNLED